MFIDSHIHISLDGRNSQKWRRDLKEGNLRPIMQVLAGYKKKNIMMLRDGGDNLGASLIARNLAGDMGMVYKTPGWAICKKGRYGSFLGKPVNDITDFKIMFDELMKVKPDHLKIVSTGIVDFDSYTRLCEVFFTFEELYYMIQFAKDRNLPVMVHANSSKAVEMAVKAGADTIEHGYFINEDILYLMAESSVVWVPTLSPLGNIIESKDPVYLNKIPNIKRIYDEHAATIKKAVDIGLKIAVGSDSGSYRVYHVQGFFDEVRHLEKCGIPKNKIFEMAFANGIRALGINLH